MDYRLDKVTSLAIMWCRTPLFKLFTH